ncbi:MAG TPA: S41 family peptidase [Vicinamibacterales bacterium]|nr:S41 family peptidase [Vicinamibacterales bacterium]
MSRASRTLMVCAMSVACCAAVLTIPGRAAQDPQAIKFAHIPHIANDGRVAFSYHDDIWVADPDGANARRLTNHIANDFSPRFSPDGKWIAFTSNRTGNNDVFLMPSAGGGEPKQLTFYSGADQALYWMPDGKSLLITTDRGPFAYGSPLFTLPIDGSVESPIKMANARLGMMKQDGSLLAFNRTLPSSGVWRKAFRGNSAPGIAVQDQKTGDIVEITNGDMKDYQNHWQDMYPMWGADGMIYFASERDGTYNVWRIAAKGGQPQQITRFKTGGVFYPSMSPDGKRMIFQHEFDLWTLDVPNGQPRKLNISLAFDPKDNDIDVLTVANLADGFSPAPDGNYVAIDARGEIQLVPSEQGIGEQTPIARTAWKEFGEQFSPDGKSIAYVSDESGDQEVWIFDIAGGTRKRLTSQESEKNGIVWAPNSQKLLYQGDNKIWEVEPAAASPAPKLIVANDAGGFSAVQYAANGTWLTYGRRDDENNAEVYLYDITAKKEYNVTQSPLTEGNGVLTPDGKYVVFTSNRAGDTNQLFAVSLARLTEDPNDPLVRERIRNATAGRSGGRGAAAGGGAEGAGPAASQVAPAKIELQGIEKRAVQLTTGANAVTGFFLSNDGRTIYFATGGAGARGRGAAPAPATPGRGQGAAAPAGGEGPALYAIDIDGRNRRTIAGGNFPGMVPTPDRRMVFFRAASSEPAGGRGAATNLVGGQEVHRLTLQGNRNERVSFTFPIRVDRRAEWKQMFEETWRVMKYRYYNPAMNGRDWAAVKSKYEPMLAYAGTNEDVYDLGNAMIGELSSSHTGMSGPASRTMDRLYTTRFLGLELEPSGGVYRINHVYRDGPADKEWLNLAVGDYVLAIDNQNLKAGDNYWKILSAATTEYVPVKVAKSAAGEGARTVRIATVTNLGNIKYEEFVQTNRDAVEKATNGQIAYVHIRSMDQPSLERFRDEIDRYWQKKGIIVDVRYNTGGNIDFELLDILERRPYMFTNSRNGARTWGRRPQQAIAGPKVMMINQRSFSDAEATPMGFRTLGIGKLVGTPTAGGVIWTGSYGLINGGSVRTPSQLAAVYDPTKPNNYGQNLENFGVPPDVWVQNSLNDEMNGIDRELQVAIEEVLKMLRVNGTK